MLGSNNYLGLTHDPRVMEAAEKAARKYGTGCTGSRFLNGTLDLHERLEEELADFLGKEAALVFSTGFQTNLGIISTLVGRDDVVVIDKLDHACIVDGAILSQARVYRYNHNDMTHLERVLERARREHPERRHARRRRRHLQHGGRSGRSAAHRAPGAPVRGAASWSTRRTPWASSARPAPAWTSISA